MILLIKNLMVISITSHGLKLYMIYQKLILLKADFMIKNLMGIIHPTVKTLYDLSKKSC